MESDYTKWFVDARIDRDGRAQLNPPNYHHFRREYPYTIPLDGIWMEIMVASAPLIHSTAFNIGIRRIDRAYLEAHLENGSMLNLKVLGACLIDEDVSPQLARETLHRVKVYGMLIASPAVNVALMGRIKVIGVSTYHQVQTETR